MIRIVSLYPIEQVQHRPHFKPDGTFVLPACTNRDNPVYLEVTHRQADDYIGMGRTIEKTILDTEIASDLLNAFARGFPGSSTDTGPAIWIPEDGRTPTNAE